MKVFNSIKVFAMISLLSGLVLAVLGCHSTPIIPKPRSFPKIEYPSGYTTQRMDEGYCAFTFEYPSYMKVTRDTLFFNEAPKNNCWFNLDIPNFNATVHFTYTPISGKKEEVYKFFNDSYRMAAEHDKRADANTDYNINNPENHVYGVLYDIEGHVASQFQFAVTDSVRHTLRAAMYFNAQPNPDSLAPMSEYLKKDMMQILNTLKWTKQ